MSSHSSQRPLTYRAKFPPFLLHSLHGSRCSRGPSASLGSIGADLGLRKPQWPQAGVPHPSVGSLFASGDCLLH